ncbi:MAG TPA: SH3 domain-containing protein [Pyrinomonadaceae bacterium]
MKSSLLFCLVIFSFFGVSAQAERFVKPLDEAKRDASFLAFRARLIAAAKTRDAQYVLSVVDKDIKNGFAGNDGVAEFKKQWNLASPNSKFWEEFTPVITNGGTFDKESGNKNMLFVAPFTFNGFPEDLDAFDYSSIFGNNVNLRAAPDASSKSLARLSYNVVKVDYQNSVKKSGSEDEYLWLKIETLGGKSGFVSAEFVRSPIDYRAGFEKKNGRWKMVFFLAGD